MNNISLSQDLLKINCPATSDTTIFQLPLEIIIMEILYHCPMKDIISFSKTCHKFKIISTHNVLWKPFFVKMFNPQWWNPPDLQSNILSQEGIQKNYFSILVNHEKIISIEMEKYSQQANEFKPQIEQEQDFMLKNVELQLIAYQHNDLKTAETSEKGITQSWIEQSVLLNKKNECEMNHVGCEGILNNFKNLPITFEWEESPQKINKCNQIKHTE